MTIREWQFYLWMIPTDYLRGVSFSLLFLSLLLIHITHTFKVVLFLLMTTAIFTRGLTQLEDAALSFLTHKN